MFYHEYKRALDTLTYNLQQKGAWYLTNKLYRIHKTAIANRTPITMSIAEEKNEMHRAFSGMIHII